MTSVPTSLVVTLCVIMLLTSFLAGLRLYPSAKAGNKPLFVSYVISMLAYGYLAGTLLDALVN